MKNEIFSIICALAFILGFSRRKGYEKRPSIKTPKEMPTQSGVKEGIRRSRRIFMALPMKGGNDV